MNFIVGIDIGGTNTDCVLVGEDKRIYRREKITTSADLSESVVSGIEAITAGLEKSAICRVCIGTTFATNAILEGKELSPVGVIRISGQRPAIPAGYEWPESLRERVIAKEITIDGGFRCDATSLTPFSSIQAEKAVRELLSECSAIAITGAYSPLNSVEEKAIEAIAYALKKEVVVAKSSDIGGIGFLMRESATILNASLKKALARSFSTMEDRIRALGVSASIYMVKNDGSVMLLADAIQNPMLTIAAGQTNSFFGASALAMVENGIVIDIGGTSTDVGLVIDCSAKRSCRKARIGGVELQFPMPDALSLALGGGTIVTIEGPRAILGPESVGRDLIRQAYCFGGSTLTLTDVALKAQRLTIAGADAGKIPLDLDQAIAIMQQVDYEIERAVAMMRGKNKELPVIICGGGALIGYRDGMLLPQESGFANAYGAAMASISSTIDRTVSLQNRERVLQEMKQHAIDDAIAKGASSASTKITHMEISPYAYSKDALARVIITASGSHR